MNVVFSQNLGFYIHLFSTTLGELNLECWMDDEAQNIPVRIEVDGCDGCRNG